MTATVNVSWADLASEELRIELRSLLTEHHPGSPPKGAEAQLEWRRDWARRSFELGIAAPAWPTEWYGMGLDLPQLVAFYEEVATARMPGATTPGAGMVGPAIMVHGTDEQRRRFLPPLLRGETLWCQGFSEPDAGSDLPSLRTTAQRDGDHYVVNGEKVWTTMAMDSNWCFALVRTGPLETRQAGISYLLIDMATTGLEVRPLRTIAGTAHFAQLILNDVRVPVDNRIGPENGGWRVTKTTLGHERSTSSIGKTTRYRSIVGDLIELAQERGQATEPHVRQRLADLHVRARLIELAAHRVLEVSLRSGEVGPISSASRLSLTIFEQQLHEVAIDVIGAHGLLAPSEMDRSVGRWLNGFLMTRATTIGGGTSEIQRNTIGEQVLGLPREPGLP